ncbi:hypothetical protein FA95DRAFT_1569585 [Auriscalpium vulgare]|uniref:Uncharacterized protein n=1 Tax=Auriscalpium vulgare TaxID=40419 RepID=A0ACB8S779_9AGAM|nr:hypothetical protein FA95DRAFT_1569585 [Auriscalpium vulgare]
MPNTNENRNTWSEQLDLLHPRQAIIDFLKEKDTEVLDVEFTQCCATTGGPADAAPWQGIFVRNRALTIACADLPLVAMVAKVASSEVDGDGRNNPGGAVFHIFPGNTQKAWARLDRQLEVYKRIKTINSLQTVDDEGWTRKLTVEQPISVGTITISHRTTSQIFTFPALAFEARGLHCHAAHILTPSTTVDPDRPSDFWHLNNGHLSLVKDFLNRCQRVGVCAGKLPHCMVVLNHTGKVFLRGLPNAVILSSMDDREFKSERDSPEARSQAGLKETLHDIELTIRKRKNDLLGTPSLPKSTLGTTPSQKLKAPPKPSFAQTEHTSRTVEPRRPRPRPYIPQRGAPLLHPILLAARPVPSDRILDVQPAESLARIAQFRSATPRVHWASPQLEHSSWAAVDVRRATYLQT